VALQLLRSHAATCKHCLSKIPTISAGRSFFTFPFIPHRQDSTKMPLPPFIPPSQVLVDDRDSSIVYSDHNIKPGGRIGKEYNDTTTGLESNSSASFSFHGTSSKVSGSLKI
jgi:hypothetical protein